MRLPAEILYNLRLLLKSPGHVIICILVIGMGMGLSITGYSILENFKPQVMPFPDGDRHVSVVGFNNTNNQRMTIDGYTFQTLQSSVQSYSAFGARRDVLATLSDGDVAEQFNGSRISPELVQALDVTPLLGRGLLPQDGIPDADPVAVISYDVWQNYYIADDNIIGTHSRINGELYTVVGVMPEGFAYPFRHDLWMPLQLPTNLQPGDGPSLSVGGVLSQSATMDSASTEINALLTRIGEAFPDTYAGYSGRLQPFATMFSADSPTVEFVIEVVPLLLTFALVLLVSLNVANLILVRTNERIQEFAICSSLGASRWRLIKSILMDSFLVCLLGSLLGVLLADVGMAIVDASFQDMSRGELPFWMAFDWKLPIAVTAFFAMLVIWLSSVALAYWQVSRLDLAEVLAAGKTGSTGSKNPLGTSVLVSTEMVFSCFLLVLGGVLVGVAKDVAELDYGTTTEGYLAGRINLATENYADTEAREAYRENLKLELLQQPGIERVSFSTALTSEYGARVPYNLEDQDLFVNDQYPFQYLIYVAPDYFQTMDLALTAGRNFDTGDTANSLPVAIIEQLLAEQMWPNESPLGKRIEILPGTPESEWLTVVGVVPHIIQSMAMDGGLDRRSLYRPLTQSTGRAFSIAVNTNGDPAAFTQTVRETANQVDRDIPITNIRLLTELIEQANAPMVFSANMFLTLALVTLVLAATGIYALVSRSVFQRSKESGIRRAVGSSNEGILWVFMRPGFKYLGLGLLLGGGSAALLTNVIDSIIPGSIIWLPSIFISVALGLGLLIFLSTYTPARLLVAMEPGDTLRDE